MPEKTTSAAKTSTPSGPSSARDILITIVLSFQGTPDWVLYKQPDALRRINMSNTLGTFIRFNFIDKLTLNDCGIGTLRFADITVNAIIGY